MKKLGFAIMLLSLMKTSFVFANQDNEKFFKQLDKVVQFKFRSWNAAAALFLSPNRALFKGYRQCLHKSPHLNYAFYSARCSWRYSKEQDALIVVLKVTTIDGPIYVEEIFNVKNKGTILTSTFEWQTITYKLRSD